MADGIEFKITGLDQAIDRMSTLPSKLQKRGLRAALRKGGNVIRDAARANARGLDDPETANSIARNITLQAMSARRARAAGGDLGVRVGVMGGARKYGNTKANRRQGRVGKSYATGGSKGNPGGDTWYWRLLEFGTSKMRAQPFMRPALSDNIDAATNAVADELSKQLDKLGA